MKSKTTLDLTFDENFSEFEITLEGGEFEFESVLSIFFNHPDNWIDHGDNIVYVYNDTLAPDSQVGSIISVYNDKKELVNVVVNREYY